MTVPRVSLGENRVREPVEKSVVMPRLSDMLVSRTISSRRNREHKRTDPRSRGRIRRDARKTSGEVNSERFVGITPRGN